MMELARNWKVIDIIIIIVLILLIFQSLVFAQALNNQIENADIHATYISSNFEPDVAKYQTNPDTNNGYYLIGSIQPGIKHKPNLANATGIIQPVPNVTASTIVDQTRSNQPVTKFTERIILPTCVFNTLFEIINEKPQSDKTITTRTYNILFNIINNKNPPVLIESRPYVASGDAGKTESLQEQGKSGNTPAIPPLGNLIEESGHEP